MPVTNRRSISADLISEKLVGIKHEVSFLLGDQTDLANYFQGIRRNSRAMGSKSSSLKTLIITPPMQVTKEGEIFLLFDTGEDPKNRIICFCKDWNLLKLLEADQWLANVTFRSSPKIFRQLWSIHAQFGERTLPMIYFLMTGKTQSC